MSDRHYDLVIVGAGFAGLYMLHRARELGFRAVVLEQGAGLGGTWYWNRYPGARCDVESHQYSYQFSESLQKEWDWPERYSTQADILAYADHVADRFDLRRDILFETRVNRLTFDDQAGCWHVTTTNGTPLSATCVVMATGCLSVPNLPPIEGRDTFEGVVYQTGRWPHEKVSFKGKRVAVIGTGSSAIQSIPLIALGTAHLTVFQRTANYSVPAHNRVHDEATRAQLKADYPAMRARAWQTPNVIDMGFNPRASLDVTAEDREREYEARWRHGGLPFMGAFADLMRSEEANRTAADFVRRKIKALVHDPETARKLSPTNIIGAKRLCVDSGYYETFNRPNVSLVDVSDETIERITSTGIIAGSRHHEIDVMVYATGFDAMTGALLNIDIEGRGGLTLQQKWSDGPVTFLGLMVAGFPNLFTVTGPGSPSVLTNMLPTIEQHVNWIAECLNALRRSGHTRIEAEAGAEQAWTAHVQDAAASTLKAHAPSWYTGENISGKPRVFMPYIGGMPAYLQKCDAVARNGYDGFRLS